MSLTICLNRLRFRLVWLRRARALRCCVYAIVPAVWSSNAAEARAPGQQLCTSADTASWTWQTVNSQFSPPQLVSHTSQEQATQNVS